MTSVSSNFPTRRVLEGKTGFERVGKELATYGNQALVGSDEGARLLEKRSGNWTEVVNFKRLVPAASISVYAAGFGSSVALSDKYAAIGTRRVKEGGGAVFVFRREEAPVSRAAPSQKWVLDATIPTRSLGFGSGGLSEVSSVALSGDTLIIGGAELGGAGGAAAVLERSQKGEWIKKAGFVGADDERLGRAVATDGEHAFLGAPQEGPGRVVVASKDRDGNWGVAGELTAQRPDELDSFGSALAVRGDTLAVGAPTAGAVPMGQGRVHVFKKQEDGWQDVARLKSSSLHGDLRLGKSVAVTAAGSVAATAYPSELGDRGLVAVFSGPAWTERTLDVPADPTGATVAALPHNDRLLIGLPGAKNSNNVAGGVVLEA